jgi:uncharacterized membrane protein
MHEFLNAILPVLGALVLCVVVIYLFVIEPRQHGPKRHETRH